MPEFEVVTPLDVQGERATVTLKREGKSFEREVKATVPDSLREWGKWTEMGSRTKNRDLVNEAGAQAFAAELTFNNLAEALVRRNMASSGNRLEDMYKADGAVTDAFKAGVLQIEDLSRSPTVEALRLARTEIQRYTTDGTVPDPGSEGRPFVDKLQAMAGKLVEVGVPAGEASNFARAILEEQLLVLESRVREGDVGKKLAWEDRGPLATRGAPVPEVSERPADSRSTAAPEPAPGTPPAEPRESAREKLAKGLTYEEFIKGCRYFRQVKVEDERGAQTIFREWWEDATEKERETYKLAAFLSRAAAQKKERSGSYKLLFPSDLSISETALAPEINGMSKEQFEILYNYPGAKYLMEEYAKDLVLFRKIKYGHRDEDEVSLVHVKDGTTLEKVRREMIRRCQRTGVDEKQAELAETMVYALMFNGNLAESCDTRLDSPLSGDILRGIREGTDYEIGPDGRLVLPEDLKVPASALGDVEAGEIRHFMHPLERSIARARQNLPWGVMSEWSTRMIGRINGILSKETFADDESRENRQKELVATMVEPELRKVYPNKLGKSFFEASTVKYEGGGDDEIPLLEALVTGKNVDMQSLGPTPFGDYNGVTMGRLKAVYKILVGDEKIEAKGEYEMGIEVGTKVVKALEGVKLNVPEWQERLILALLHDVKQVKLTMTHEGGGKLQKLNLTRRVARYDLFAGLKKTGVMNDLSTGEFIGRLLS